VLWELQPALQTDVLKLSEGFLAEKIARLMKACAAMGLEGVIMKRKGSVYRPDFRSPDWLKVPIRHREEFVVGGHLPSPRGFSTLILGQFNSDGNFAYAGSCGTGLSENDARGAPRRTPGNPPENAPVPHLRDDFLELPDTPPQWVRPAVIVEVEYRQRLKGGLR
jgi:bifunctional non-homologous end joining protein LigD